MMNWFDYWHTIEDITKTLGLADLLQQCCFFPAVRQAVPLLLNLPATTCRPTIERSFSTLRRVKTWLRSTMSDSRLSALCMISVHRQLVIRDKKQFVSDFIENFASHSRRLQFAFAL